MNSEHHIIPRQRRTIRKPFRQRSPLKKYGIILAVCSLAALAMHFFSEQARQPPEAAAAEETKQ